MADLNPLKFLVAIQDDATGQLNEIQKKLETLKEHTIKLKVEGKEEIHTAFNIDKLVEQIQNAKRALSGDSFEKFSTYMTNAAESVDKLTEAFVKFKSTIGSNQDIKDMLSGWGAAIREINAAMAAANATKSSAGGKKGASGQTTDELKQQEQGLVKVADAIGRVRSAMASGGASGGIPFLENINVIGERNIQTLIKEQGHIDRLIAIAKKSIDFGEGHPVLGMGRLRGDQMRNLQDLEALKKVITEILFAANQGDQAMIRFLNTSSALRTTPFGKDAMGNDVTLLGGHFDKLTHSVTGTASAMRNLNKEMRLDVNAKTIGQQWADSMTKAGRAASDLETKLEKLRISGIRESATKAGLNTDAYDKAIERIQRYQRVLEYIQQRGGHDASRILGSVGYRTSLNDLNVQSAALTKNIAEKERAANATRQLTADEQRLAQALGQSTDHMNRQSTLLSDLKSLATQYLGVWGGQQFLNNIIQIGGQLEMQRLSIGAILQNQAQANTLFNQIKGLATQSPFGVVELDQMTKQLTAYGFKYHELFDMTKRLADISAATGTSVDRLALALGHVRSEAALSGYTLRQFSMGNVPLLQKLSEKLGKTTKEIRDMVKKKEISYDDVVGVLKDLTNEGGMFYNMQEVISQSVKAKFKNVKDAMDIMYGEMAEGGIGDALKSVASVLMELTRNWKDVATVMGTVAVLWGVHRAAVMVYTQTLGAANAQTMASIAAHRQKEAAMLREAQVYRSLTASEQTQLAASRALTVGMRTRMALGMQLTMTQRRRLLVSRQQQVMDMALALSEKKLTTEHILRQVALGKLSHAQARTIISLANLSAVERQAAMNAINGTRQIGMFSMAIWNMGNSALGALAKLGKFLLNPQMLIMAGITAAMELWQRNSREVERAEEVADSIYQHSQDAIRNTKSMMQSDMAPLSIVGQNGSDINTMDLDFNNISDAKIKFPEVDRSQMQQVLDEWTTYIENYAVNAGQILNQASFDAQGNLLPLEERFNNLKKAIEEVVLAQYGLQDIGDVFANAVKATNGGWFDEDVLTDIGDYDKKIRSFSSNVATAYRKYQKAIDDGVKAAIRQSDSFAKATKEMDTYGQMFDLLMKKQGEFPDAFAAFRSVEGTGDATFDINESLFNTTSGDMNRAKQEMLAELDSFYVQVEAEMQTKGVDLNNLTTQQQQSMLIGYKKQLESIQGLSQETMNWLMQMFAQHFDIPLDLDDSKFIPKVNEVTETLNNLVEGDWKVDLDFVEHINDAIDEARKKYKLAKEYFEKTEKIRLKFGIDLKLGQLMDDKTKQSVLSKIENEDIRKEVEKVINGLNQASTAFNKSTEASRNLGFSLEDEKKGKKKSTGKKTGTGHKEDTQAKAWRERIRQLKDARQWYDKWEKEIGETSALEKVQEIFHGLIRKEDIKTLEAYEKALKAVKSEAESRKAKNKGKDERAEEIIRQTDDELAQIDMLKFQRDSETALGKMDKYLDRVARHWETFKSVLEATGDKMLAMKLAGFDEYDSNFAVSPSDALMNRLEMEMMLPNLQQQLIDVGIMEMSDTEIEKYIKSWLGGTEYKKYIDAITKGVKEWKRMEQSYINESVQDYARLIGSAVDYQTQVDKINAEYAKTREHLTKLLELGQEGKEGGITKEQYDEALELARVMRDDKTLKLSSTYLNLLNRANALSREEMLSAFEIGVSNLDQKLSHGLITLEDYTQELAKLKKITEEWEENAFFGKNNMLTNFLQGGAPGLKNWLEVRRDLYTASGEQDEADTYQGYIDTLDDVTNLLGDLGVVVELATGALDGMQKATTALSNMFEALGLHGKANRWSDISSGIGAVSSAFNPVSNVIQNAQSGNVGGLLSSVISAPFEMITNPIKGFAELHDRKRERAIEEIRKEVQQIGSTLNLIRMSRERTLGFDKGEYRRMMATLYAGSSNASGKGMYEYYTRGGTDSNGYMQELQMLKQQREDYLKMYDKEHSKKNESKEALEEYKTKIAELDDQIRFFSQDLAKELWDIDIKGWADQLSDALASAFENGESMANAYKDTVTSILQSLAQRMLKTAYLEKMFESLQDRLFGPNGVVDPTDMQGSMSKATSVIADFFGKGGEGEQTIAAATEFMTAFQRGLESSGLSLLNDSGKTLSSSVQGTSEETSNLLAAYVNALRQDVSINRLLLTEFIAQQWPSYLEEFTNHVRTVARIDNNVQVMMEMMRDGRGAMYEEIHSLRSRIDNVVNGIESFAMK